MPSRYLKSGRSKTSRLQSDLARRILRQLNHQGAQPGHHLVELNLCATFGVSRTPVRGALQLLAVQGVVTARAGRGYVLTKLPPAMTEDDAKAETEDGERLFDSLFHALAKARSTGKLKDQFSQQQVVRRLDARLATVLAVLRALAELGLVERKPGNGWAFVGDSARHLNESYAFRRALEPQMLLQPGFKLDRAWAEKARLEHQKLRKKVWRPGDGARFHAVNADFHEQLARCCGNRTMLRAIRAQNQLRQFLIGDWEYPIEQVHNAIDDHLEILAALEAGYADKAAALMLHHLTQSASQSQKDEPSAA